MKTCLVTGATDGIGKATAVELARRGARVLLHGRSIAKAEAACAHVRAQSKGADVAPLAGDLASLHEVRELARNAVASGPIDVFVSNAGVFANQRTVTVDGFELTFAVNHLAPFLLAHLLLDAIAAQRGRVVVVSSVAHTRGAIDFDNLDASKRFNAYGAYAASKLANVLFAFELARRTKDRGVTSNALHPGVITTKLLKEGFGIGGDSVERGAATSVHLALEPSLEGVTGKYFSDEREVVAAPSARDRDLQRRLYEVSCELTGVAPLPS